MSDIKGGVRSGCWNEDGFGDWWDIIAKLGKSECDSVLSRSQTIIWASMALD